MPERRPCGAGVTLGEVGAGRRSGPARGGGPGRAGLGATGIKKPDGSGADRGRAARLVEPPTPPPGRGGGVGAAEHPPKSSVAAPPRGIGLAAVAWDLRHRLRPSRNTQYRPNPSPPPSAEAGQSQTKRGQSFMFGKTAAMFSRSRTYSGRSRAKVSRLLRGNHNRAAYHSTRTSTRVRAPTGCPGEHIKPD